MATIKFLESGTDATQGTEFYDILSGANITSDNTVFHTGTRSLKLNCGSPAVTQIATRTGVMADAGRRVSLWFRFDTMPVGNCNFIAVRDSANANLALFILLNSSGNIGISTGSGTVGSSVLAINTWYRISFSYTIAATNSYSIKLYLNGALELSATQATNGNLTRTGSDRLLLQENTAFGTNASIWYDDIYVDDGTDLADPGNILVTSKLPFANGTTNGFTGTGTPSGYGTGNARYVNEQPLSTTNYVSVLGAGSAITEEYNIENPTVTDVNLNGQSIIDYCGWIYAKVAVGTEAAQLILNNVNNAKTITTTATLFMAFAGSKIYPAGTGTDIGVITDISITTFTLYECGILIAYKRNDGNFFPFF